MQANGSVEPRAAGDLAVVLTGGGARGAYQVGVLRWIARRHPDIHFPIVTGVSAGAISATFLAAWQGSHAEAIEELRRLWSGLTIDRIFRADGWSLTSHVARWGARLLSGGSSLVPAVRGLVDAAPLNETLSKVFDVRDGGGIGGIAENVGRRAPVGAGAGDQPLRERSVGGLDRGPRVERLAPPGPPQPARENHARPHPGLVGAAARLSRGAAGRRLARRRRHPSHGPLLASAAPRGQPGAGRVDAPCAGRRGEAGAPASEAYAAGYPPPLQISGQLLNAVFLDDLDRDALELERVNRLLRDVPAPRRRGLRPVKLVVVRPTVDISRLAAQHEPRLPPAFRYLIRGPRLARRAGARPAQPAGVPAGVSRPAD